MARGLLMLQVVRIAGRAVFALVPNVYVAVIVGFAEPVIRTTFHPLFNAWLIRRTDEGVRATVLSATSVASEFGQVGGGPISGAIGNSAGIPLALLSSAAMLVPGMLFFARAAGPRRADAADPEGPVTTA
ncbi:MAG: hypothetical protein M3R54_10615 [Chloroflexota bacterium]|nr:hypothetical protein [Chloroflexota bacterium]